MLSKKLLFIIFLLLVTNIFSQIRAGRDQAYKEIFTNTENINSGDTVFFRLEAVGHVWNDEGGIDIITSYDGESVRNSTIPIVGNYSDSEKGWDHVSGTTGDVEKPYFGFGKYKFVIKKGIAGDSVTFWIDFRDSLHVSGAVRYSCTNDIWMNYDYDEVEINWGSTCGTQTVADSSTYTIWGEKNNTGSPIQACFYPGAPYSLSVSDSSNHPKLTWSHNQDSDGSYSYEVWRDESQLPGPSGNWAKIATTSNFNYYDTDIYIGDGSWGTAFYKIRTKLNTDNYYSTYSNVDDIDFEGYEKRLIDDEIESAYITNSLFGNHPNPFNPTTTITYSIAQKGQVSLRVYNSLAQEVALLVNEIKSEGNYSVRFDASNLPSGVYFYKLETDYFTDVKKMVVAK
jgi:hypothetical protein